MNATINRLHSTFPMDTCPHCWDDHPVTVPCTTCVIHPGTIALGGTGHCDACWENDMADMATTDCGICGKSFTPTHGQVVMFCSTECYWEDCNRYAEEHYAQQESTMTFSTCGCNNPHCRAYNEHSGLPCSQECLEYNTWMDDQYAMDISDVCGCNAPDCAVCNADAQEAYEATFTPEQWAALDAEFNVRSLMESAEWRTTQFRMERMAFWDMIDMIDMPPYCQWDVWTRNIFITYPGVFLGGV